MLPPERPPSPRRVALVTGAARRIGRAIALRLAAEGFDLAVHSADASHGADDTVAEIEATGARAAAFFADLKDEGAAEALLPQVLARFGRVDAVVNNASMFHYDDVESLRYEHLTAHLQVNVGAAVVLTRALHRHLREAGRRGAVVNLLDQRLWNPNPDYLSYGLSKAALEFATRTLAVALAPELRVVGVAPGLTTGSAIIDDARLAAMTGQSLTRQLPTLDNVAASVAFAIGNDAMTGSVLMVDAGFHLRPMARDFPFMPL